MEGVGNLRVPTVCGSVSSIADNFDYYSKPIVDAVQHSSYEEKILPKNGVSSGPYIFDIDTNDCFLSMSDMMLYCKAEVTKADGKSEEIDDGTVATINGLLNTMWKSIETRVNNVQINAASSYCSGYKAYIENVLSYESARDGAVVGTRFFMDTPRKFKENLQNNKGFQYRSKDIDEGPFDMCGIIHSDFLRSDNHLSPNNKLQLIFTKYDDRIILQKSNAADTENYKLVIHELAIYVRKTRLTNEGMRALYHPGKPERYLTVHTEMKQHPLPSGLTNYTLKLNNTAESNHVPKMVVIAQIATQALNGDYNLNALEFEHFNLNKINLKLNGSQIPQQPLTPDFDNLLCTRSYVELFKNTGKFRTNETNLIDRATFIHGCTIFPFDLTPDQCNGHHIHGGSEGTLELDLGWSVALPRPITILVYMTADQVVMINPPGSAMPVQSNLF